MIRRGTFALPTTAQRPQRAAAAQPVPPAAARSGGRVRRLPLNEHGRDFVVGDIHGCFDQVIEGLRRVGFDRRVDRLFSVGDTVDRGPGSPRVRQFLDQPWVHAVRGNHEYMFLELYESGDDPHPAAVEFITARNGMLWWRDLGQEDRLDLIARFRKLPVVIEVETRRGLVGLVHAGVPKGLDWETFIARVEAGDRKVTHDALWDRDRVLAEDDSGVPGIDRLFVGHTPQKGPLRLGNVYYVDTGAVFGVLKPEAPRGRLTIADLCMRTAVLERAPQPDTDLVDARPETEPTDAPYGAYARR